MDFMAIDSIDDCEQRAARQQAFWQCEIIDRPVVIAGVAKVPGLEIPAPDLRNWATPEALTEAQIAQLNNTIFLGDALPTVFPNIGPDFFPACFAGTLEFVELTSHIIPFMNDLDEVANLKFDWTNQYFQAIERQIELHLERCKGQYYIMLPDLHPGSDCLAAWRGPANLCMDLLDYPEKVKSALALIMQPYFDCFEHYMEILRANNLPCACWSGMVSSRPYAIPSSDFSFMIGNEEFESLLLPGLIEECKHFPDNIFHVDGIGVLRHLDLLLEIPELNAIQWVCGAGGGRATDWLEVYRRCQSKGKAIQIFSTVAEVDTLIENLRPEGVWLRVDDVQSVDEFDAIMKKINKWT